MTQVNKVINRSAAYPAIHLEEAIAASGTIRTKLGKGPYNRDTLAAALGYTSTGSATRKIAAMVHFGLLTRKGNSYSQNELTERIILPTSPEDRETAIRESIRSPKLYDSLIAKYEEQSLPTLLNNILAREFGINEKVAQDVAQDFIRSSEFAGILRNGVIVGNTSTNPGAIADDEEVSRQKPPIQRPADSQPNLDTGMQQIALPSGIIIVFPQSLSYHFGLGKFALPIQQLEETAAKIVKKEPNEADQANGDDKEKN